MSCILKVIVMLIFKLLNVSFLLLVEDLRNVYV